MAFSKMLAAQLIGAVFGKNSYTPSVIYVGLSSTTGTDAVVEITGDDYARIPTTNADWTSVDSSGSATVRNANALTFAQAGNSWGTVKEAVLYDAAIDGNVLARADAAIDKEVETGDIVALLAQKLIFVLF